MAKKRKPKSPPVTSKRPRSTSDLTADPRNPRFISDASADGLAASIDEFGDLSGIVWNKRTDMLVAGHRRLEQIEKKWGPQTIEIIDEARELGIIRIDDEHCFVIRIVDWPMEKQVTANVTANNPKIQGEFTGDVVGYVRDIQELLADNAPSLLDDVLLTDLLADYASEPTKLSSVSVKPPPAFVWVLVGIQTPRFGRIAELVDQLGSVPDIIVESTLNDGK